MPGSLRLPETPVLPVPAAPALGYDVLMSFKRVAIVTACLCIGAGVSVTAGQDVNWDLLNYHIRNAYAVLDGRLETDLGTAGMQSFFNPALDLPYYLLATGPFATHPALLAAAMGLPYGCMILVTLGLARRVLPPMDPLPGAVAVTAATAAAVTGAASLTQAGTAFNEVQVAALALWGVLTLLPRAGAVTPGAPRAMAGGVLLGLAAGFKLTAAIYAPAIVLGVLLAGGARDGLPRVARFFAAICAGWAIAFAAAAGWWTVWLAGRFGSPVFPLFNAVFHSPWFPPMNVLDNRFLPRTALQWLFYPFWWATWRDVPLNTELPYRDPRLAMALVVFAALALAALWRMAMRTDAGRPATWAPQQRVLFWFAAIAYVLWLAGAAIMRYGIVIEVAGTLAVAVALMRVVKAAAGRWNGHAGAGAVAVMALACMAWTRPADYGHVPFGPRVFDIDMAWTPPDTLFVAITGPTAYLTAFVPASARARSVGFSFLNQLAEGWPLNTETAAIIARASGPIYVLVPPDDTTMVRSLPLVGLDPALGPCRMIASNLDRGQTRACEAKRL